MKKVVVMLPVQQRHMDLFRQQVSAYPGAYEFVFLTRQDSVETASQEIKDAGRGNAVDLDALKAVLRDGHLGGAALDVTAPEPLPVGDDLWDFPNVIITPHAAGGFLLPETFERVVRIAADNLNRYASGQELTRKVNRETGY